jgi:stress response protein SCP2
MLTVFDCNRITFAHHRGIVPPAPAKEGEKTVEPRYVCSANMKLIEYGYTMSYDLFMAFCNATHAAFLEAWSALYDLAMEDAKAISKTSPIWPNFPDDAMEADLVDLYVVNLLNYLTLGQWQPDFDPSKFCKALDREHLPAAKQIPACDADEIYRYVTQSITGNSPLSPDERNTVIDLLTHGGEDFLNHLMGMMKDKHITCKENLALYASFIINRPDWRSQQCFLDFNSSTDVLRLAAAMSGQDVSLVKPPRFRSFKRSERRELLYLLEHVEKNEGFALRPEEFKRLGEKLHPGEYAKYFPENKAIFDKVRNGVHIETYNSKLQELLKKPVNVDVLTAHLMLRPGVFARYLDFALRNCSDEHQMEDVLFCFISVCKNVSPRVLVQLINHFRNRNNPVQLATGKANGAGSAALDREIEPISDVMCNRVSRDIFNQLWQVLRAEDTEPKSIYIDPACHCNKLIFPDNPRQISSAMRATACGSRTQLPDGNVLRAFLYWKGNDGADLWDGIDLDLSVVFYGEKEANFVFYGEPKDERLGAIHSGDRRCSGPHGAVEYVDFDIKKCLQNGIRYAALVVNSYSGEKFSEMDAAFCGVMVRDGETGEQFEPATVKDRFALTTDAGQIIMVVIDLLNREVVTVDKSIAQVRVACRNVVTDYAPTVDICSYAMQLKSLSIKEMLGMRYAKFLKDNEWEQASVIVSDEPGKFRQTKEGVPAPRVVSPYDIPGIYDIVFGTESK